MSEECIVRRQHCASQSRNHLQTVEAPVLAAEEDLLWGWTENKEQLCKLYRATLWEMPFPFPTGKCAGRCFQRGLSCYPTAQTLPSMAHWADLAQLQCPGPGCKSDPAVCGGTASPDCSGGPGEEGFFLGLSVLICLLSPRSHILSDHQLSECQYWSCHSSAQDPSTALSAAVRVEPKLLTL